MAIRRAVGRDAPNDAADVQEVQRLLNRHGRWLGGASPPRVDGRFSGETERAIAGFQKDGAALADADGVVSVNGFTLERLSLPDIPGPQHRIFRPLCWAHPDDVLTDADFMAAAATLECEVAAIRAVADTEAKEEPWEQSPLRRPLILFERHKFSSHTNRRYDRTHPDISSPSWGGYGASSKQYERLRRAAMLDERAALKSASWGLFQILGENHVAAGFASVESFVDAMLVNRRKHLDAFAHFVAANSRMRKAIQTKDWASFARYYNGPHYDDNDYDGKMERAYERFSPPVQRGAR